MSRYLAPGSMMNGRRRWLILLICGTLSGCASPGSKGHDEHDPMCREIARFANASTDDALHEVELFTDWSDMEMGCGHEQGYQPAVELCKILADHASIEFADSNIARALTCLPGGAALLKNEMGLKSDRGSLASMKARYVHPGVRVAIDYAIRQEHALPVMKISVQRMR